MKKSGGIAIIYDEELKFFDLVIENEDLKGDNDLITIGLISILSDRRSVSDDDPPDQKGWVGDALRKGNESLIGSRLWLLRSEKTTDETLVRANEYVTEALQSLIDDGIAVTVDVTSEYRDKIRGIIAIEAAIIKPSGELDTKFEILWDQLGVN